MQRMVVGLLVAVWASVASAASVPVSYRVDAKALKAAVSGTELTFELYRDAACTQVHHSATAAIDDLDFVAQMKLFKPKGGAKLPKSAELRHTLDGVQVAGNLYLRVTGTGITPLGGTCQLQASAGTGRSGTSAVVTDATGALVGVADGGVVLVTDPASGQVINATYRPSGFFPSWYAYYESEDCSGDGYLAASPNSPVREASGSEDGLLYIPGAGSALITVASQVQAPVSEAECSTLGLGWTFVAPNRCCCGSPCMNSSTDYYAPMTTIDVSQFVPPFKIELK